MRLYLNAIVVGKVYRDSYKCETIKLDLWRIVIFSEISGH